MKKLLFPVLIYLFSYTIPVFAQSQQNATSGNCSPIIVDTASAVVNCFQGDTQETLMARHDAVLEELTSHTPISYVEQEMGQPNMVRLLDNTLEIRVWNSINFQLFALLMSENVVGFGVMGSEDTKIPLLRWIDNSQLKHQILKDQTCDSPPINIDARFIYFEVSGCWQGRGGGYYYFEYAFYGQDCLDDVGWGPVEFSDIIELECAKANAPFLALVRFDQTDETPTPPFVHLVTEFFFWTF